MIKQPPKTVQTYVTPEASVIKFQIEGCFAASFSNILLDMEDNSIYDEIF